MAFSSGYNSVLLVGTVVSDITPIEKNGQTIGCRFNVGVTRKPQKDKNGNQMPQQTDYIPCTAWGWTGKRIIDKYQKKTPIVVHGQWQSGSYTDKTGKKVYTNTCNVGEVYDFMNGTAQGADMTHPQVQSDPIADMLGISDEEAGAYPAVDPNDLPW